MDAIPHPVLGGRDLARGVEDGLKADVGGVVFLRKPGDDLLALLETGEPCAVSWFSRACGQCEGFAEHKTDVGIDGDGGGEQIVVCLYVLVGRNFGAVVVNADENAEDSGFQVEGVMLPASFQIGDFVAADSAVEEGEFTIGIESTVFRCDDELVAVTEGVVGVFITPAVAVGDGVALKQDAGAFLKNGDGRFLCVRNAKQCGEGGDDGEAHGFLCDS